ncbi:MAG: dipeptide ABC transporter ATP-binding protein, partial [Bacteroidales bacterium]|nr:dipeptide ABC transporter ATP-binding protein [Bacteroidales bacterium]
MMKSVKLPDIDRVYKSYPHELSGGQKQRLMIAMAMANEPELLIADEPTTALDVSVQKTILNLLMELKNKMNTSILFITHDLGVVAEIADRIAVMYQGELVETGDVKDVLQNPQHDYTKALLACRPPLNSRPFRLPTISNYLDADHSHETHLISAEEREGIHKKIYDSKPLLRIEDLIVSFDTKKNFFGKTTQTFDAVRAVNFELHQGETLGLVGESGCGKTSLSRALLGLQKSKSGKISWQDENILQFSTKQWRNFRRKVQIIFQDPYGSLNPLIPIGDAIMESLIVHELLSKKEAKEQAIILMEKTGVDPNSFYKLPSEFSGGQRQRISIARALAMKPEIIICDESVSALDVSVQAQILNLLNQLKDELQLSYLFISHDLSVVKYMSDRIMVMKEGKIVEIQEADTLFNKPQNEYTQMLISSIPGIG